MEEREVLTFDNENDVIIIIHEDGWEYVDEDYYDEYFTESGDPIKPHVSGEFKIITSEVDYYDMEKSYEKINVVVQRKFDGKFFMGSYTFGYWDINEFSKTLYEVQKVEKTITVYE